MSVKELRIVNEKLTVLLVQDYCDYIQLTFTGGYILKLDRNQADLLKLWLEEHLK